MNGELGVKFGWKPFVCCFSDLFICFLYLSWTWINILTFFLWYVSSGLLDHCRVFLSQTAVTLTLSPKLVLDCRQSLQEMVKQNRLSHTGTTSGNWRWMNLLSNVWSSRFFSIKNPCRLPLANCFSRNLHIYTLRQGRIQRKQHVCKSGHTWPKLIKKRSQDMYSLKRVQSNRSSNTVK